MLRLSTRVQTVTEVLRPQLLEAAVLSSNRDDLGVGHADDILHRRQEICELPWIVGQLAPKEGAQRKGSRGTTHPCNTRTAVMVIGIPEEGVLIQLQGFADEDRPKPVHSQQGS